MPNNKNGFTLFKQEQPACRHAELDSASRRLLNKERFRIKYGMTNGTVRGFTLIELLVVVLIIGILAAVAVPQYQKAVENARFVQITTAIKAIYDAQEIYYLANNKFTTDFNELSINIGKIDSTNSNTIRIGKMSCTLDEVWMFTCHSGNSHLLVQNWYNPKGQQCCVYTYDNFKEEHLCQRLKNTTTFKPNGPHRCY